MGIRLKHGQVWTISKGAIKKIYDINNGLVISNKVKITEFVGCDGLVQVECLVSKVKLDLNSKSLIKLDEERN